MKSIQETLQDEWDEALMSSDIEEQRHIAEHATFYLLLYCGSLRGFEGPKATLHDLRRQIVSPGSELASRSGAHLGLSLTGRFKARSQYTDTILIHIAYETASGLQPGLWVERLINVLERMGITNGWVFQEQDGDQRKMAHFETDFYDRLYKIQTTQPDLFTAPWPGRGPRPAKASRKERPHCPDGRGKATAGGRDGLEQQHCPEKGRRGAREKDWWTWASRRGGRGRGHDDPGPERETGRIIWL